MFHTESKETAPEYVGAPLKGLTPLGSFVILKRARILLLLSGPLNSTSPPYAALPSFLRLLLPLVRRVPEAKNKPSTALTMYTKPPVLAIDS